MPNALESETSDTELEKIPFSPESVEELSSKLGEFGILDKVSVDTDGSPIMWDEFKLKKLFDDFSQGEREFYVVDYEDPSGEHFSRLETFQTSIRAFVYHTDPITGVTYKLVQYRATEKTHADGVVETTTPIRKKVDSSMSGKVIKGSDEDETLLKEMQEEIGVDSSQYSILSKSPATTESSFSVGYPGLYTRFNFSSYTININPDSVKEEYIERGKTIISESTGDTETPLNIFRWEKV